MSKGYWVAFVNVKNKIRKINIIPKGAKCRNYAFDVTPSKYITKIITDIKNVDANFESINSLR